jgi:hypothetical protein
MPDQTPAVGMERKLLGFVKRKSHYKWLGKPDFMQFS